MSKKFNLLLFCLIYLFCFSQNSFANSVNYNSLDLSKTYFLALKNDSEFQIQHFSALANKEKINQAKAALLPQINISAKSIYNKATIKPENSVQSFQPKYNSNAYQIDFIQPLFRWNLLQNYRQAADLFEKADLEFLQSQQNLILKTARLFFDLQIAQQNLIAAENNLAAISQQLDLAKYNFDVGTATITDFHESKARFDLAKSQKISAQNQMEMANANLQNLIANSQNTQNSFKFLKLNDFENVDKLQQKIQKLLQNLDLNQAKKSAKNDNLAVKIQKFNLKIAQKETAKSRGNFLPSVDFVAQHAKSKDISQATLLPTHANINSVGVVISLPIFQSGLTISQVRENLYNQQAAESALSLAEKSADLQTEQFFLTTQNGLAEIVALKSAWKSSQTALQSTKTAAEIGLRINLDILNAQTQIYQTKVKLFKAIFDTIFSALSLKAAIGNLNEQDITTINQMLFE